MRRWAFLYGEYRKHQGLRQTLPVGPAAPIWANIASAWGSQKVISMARYSSMAADSSARACSCWPSLAYRVPRPWWQWATQRAHAELLGQGEGLSVVGFSFFDMRRIALRRNVAEEAQGIRLVAAFLVLTGMRQRALGEGVRLLQAASQQLRLPQGETTERLKVYSFRCSGLFHRLREQRHGVGDAPGQGICRTQGRSHPGEPAREVRVLTDAHGPFEQGERPGQVALAEGQQTDPPRGNHEAPGVSHRLGNPQPFVPEGTALGEHAQLGMAPGEVGTGEHGGQVDLTEALAAPRPVEGRHGLPEAVDRPTIVALGPVG